MAWCAAARLMSLHVGVARLTLDEAEFALYEQVYARLAIDAPVPDAMMGAADRRMGQHSSATPPVPQALPARARTRSRRPAVGG